jgi:hypothetical protein
VVLPASTQDRGSLRAIRADGADGAYLAWADRHDAPGQGGYVGEVWMTHVTAPATLGVPPRQAGTRITLSPPRPNPARGAFAIDVTLAGDSPARVELFDVAGRIVRTQQLQGAGTHAVRFDALGMLEPGLYFVRAANRGATRSTRLVLTR